MRLGLVRLRFSQLETLLTAIETYIEQRQQSLQVEVDPLYTQQYRQELETAQEIHDWLVESNGDIHRYDDHLKCRWILTLLERLCRVNNPDGRLRLDKPTHPLDQYNRWAKYQRLINRLER